MGWIEKSEITKAREGAVDWVKCWFPNNIITLYDLQLLIIVVSQFIYGTVAIYCPKENGKYKVNSDILSYLLPFHHRICTQIVRCRNKICHVNGTTIANSLLQEMFEQSADILDLMRFLGLLPSESLESRIKILSTDKLAVSDPIRIIEETNWSDIVLLVSRL